MSFHMPVLRAVLGAQFELQHTANFTDGIDLYLL